MWKDELTFKKIVSDFVDGFYRHDILTLSAALAFYTIFSLAPLVLVILSVVGLSGVNLKPEILSEIQRYLGPEVSRAIKAIIENSKSEPNRSSLAGIVGSVMLLFSASCVFAQLQTSLNIIWRSRLRKSTVISQWLIQRVLSILMLMMLAILVLGTLLISAMMSYFIDKGSMWQFADTAIPLTVFVFLFGSLFKLIPDSQLNWKEALFGGLFTSVMFMTGKYLIGLYLSQGAMTSAYGAAGSLVILLIWVYYSAVIFFMGAEFTRTLSVPVKEEGTA